jgi:hypothetical protein
MKEDQTIIDAKKCLKAHIKFLEGLLAALNRNDPTMKAGAIWTSWCLHNYINKRLAPDIEKAMNDLEEIH